MTEMVGLTACSKSKRGEDEKDREFPAKDLYDSWLFDGRVEALKAHCDQWAIFSAKHGLVEPDDELTWYDNRITELSREERRELALEVVEGLPETEQVMILMGRDYADPLKWALPDDVEVWDPLEGVGLFDQRGELRDLAAETEQTRLVTDGGTVEDTIGREEPDEIISNGGRNSDGSPRMLSRWTFQYAPARRIVEEHIHGRTLNACAGRTKLQHDGEIVRNDLNPDRDVDTHLDVAEIADHFASGSFDTVIFDPPFDQKQADDKYDGLHASDVYAALGQFNELVRAGGHVITFGWNSWGMRSFPAFERVETVLLQRGPIHRDFIVSVDHRSTSSLADGGWNNRSQDTGTDQEADRR